MSLKKIKLITITMVLCSVFLGCRKKSPEYDYINQYVGEYWAVVHYYQSTSGFIKPIDTIIYEKWKVEKSNEGPSLINVYVENPQPQASFFKEGKNIFVNSSGGTSYGKRFFFIDENTLYYWNEYQYPGSFWSERVYGKKIK